MRHDPHRLPNRSLDRRRGKSLPEGNPHRNHGPGRRRFALRITGADFDRSWESVAAFEAEENVFAEGPYKIAVEHGDPETEGPDKPYFSGSTDIDVAARRVNTAQVTAHVAKSQTFVRITEAFAKFYHDAEFTVTTGSGNEFTFRPDGTGDPERIWVKTARRSRSAARPAAKARTARRKAPSTPSPPRRSTPPWRPPATSSPSTHRTPGSASLNIVLGEGEGETRVIPVELNEEAIPSK